jgi:hypothetical protein
VWCHNDILGIAIYSLLFTSFDVLGWYNIIRRIEQFSDSLLADDEYADVPIQEAMEAKISYRIMQTMMQVVFLIPVYFFWSWYAVAGSVLFWWCLGDDILYYYIAKVAFPKKEENVNWVSWSVLMSRKVKGNTFTYIGHILPVIILIAGYFIDRRKK